MWLLSNQHDHTTKYIIYTPLNTNRRNASICVNICLFAMWCQWHVSHKGQGGKNHQQASDDEDPGEYCHLCIPTVLVALSHMKCFMSFYSGQHYYYFLNQAIVFTYFCKTAEGYVCGGRWERMRWGVVCVLSVSISVSVLCVILYVCKFNLAAEYSVWKSWYCLTVRHTTMVPYQILPEICFRFHCVNKLHEQYGITC